jgi:hypothetical protein
MRKLMLLALVVLLLGFAAVPATAGPKGTNRPFKANLAGEVTFDFGSPKCFGIGPVLTITESWGNATHMGRVQADWEHCPLEVGFTNGELMMIAANGDELHFEYENFTSGLSFPMSIVGGTGGFDGASGSVAASAVIDPAFIPGCPIDPDNPFPCFDFFTPWGWAGSINGVISY